MTITNTALAQRMDDLLTQYEKVVEGQLLLPVQAYQTETADADPGAGNFRLNNANLTLVTEAYIDDVDADGTSIEAFISTYDDSGSITKGTLILRSSDTPTNFAAYRVTGAVTDADGYSKIDLEHIFSNGTWAADETFGQAFYRSGDPGAASALAAGIVTTLEPGASVAVEITGTAPNQIIDIGIPKGDKGDTGPPPNVTIGNVDTGEPGTNVIATLLGTSPNYVLNLTIPEGDEGDQGEEGFGFVYGSGAPDDVADGRDGDTFLDRDNAVIYMRKVAGAWPAGVNLKGTKGDKGDTGDTPPGWYMSAGIPDAAGGADGWMALDYINLNVYGPKTGGVWGVATTLKGDPGDGTGDVTGPSAAIIDNIPVFGSQTGKTLKDSGFSVDDIRQEITDLGPLSKPVVQDLTSDIAITGPAWLEHDGLAAHTVTISEFLEGDAIFLTDPDQALADHNVTLVSRVLGAERLTNATLSDVGVDTDYGADGIHRVPTGWGAELPANVNASGWSILNGIVQFEVTTAGGGMNQASAFETEKRHKVTGRARKISGDTAATLNVSVTGNTIGTDATEVIPADDLTWTDFELDVEPTGTGIALTCLNGVAVWEVDSVSIKRYAQFWLSPTAHDDTLVLDTTGRRGFTYRATKERFVLI